MGYNALQEYKWALRSDKSRHSLDSVNRKCSYFRSYIKKFKFKGKKWEQSCAILLEQGKTPKMIVPILLKMGEHENISGSHPPLRGGPVLHHSWSWGPLCCMFWDTSLVCYSNRIQTKGHGLHSFQVELLLSILVQFYKSFYAFSSQFRFLKDPQM